MLVVTRKGIFVKSYTQPESHSHGVDVAVHKMCIFARVIHVSS